MSYWPISISSKSLLAIQLWIFFFCRITVVFCYYFPPLLHLLACISPWHLILRFSGYTSNLSRSFALTAVGNNFTLHTIYTYHTFPFAYFRCIWKIRTIFFLFCYLRNIKNVIYNFPSFAQGFRWFTGHLSPRKSDYYWWLGAWRCRWKPRRLCQST